MLSRTPLQHATIVLLAIDIALGACILAILLAIAARCLASRARAWLRCPFRRGPPSPGDQHDQEAAPPREADEAAAAAAVPDPPPLLPPLRENDDDDDDMSGTATLGLPSLRSGGAVVVPTPAVEGVEASGSIGPAGS